MTDDGEQILALLQMADTLESQQVDLGRRVLKQYGGLSDETSYRLIAQAKQIVKEANKDIPAASKARTCAKREQLTDIAKLAAQLSAEEATVNEARRQKANAIAFTVSPQERERMLASFRRSSSISSTSVDYAAALRGVPPADVLNRMCGSQS